MEGLLDEPLAEINERARYRAPQRPAQEIETLLTSTNWREPVQ